METICGLLLLLSGIRFEFGGIIFVGDLAVFTIVLYGLVSKKRSFKEPIQFGATHVLLLLFAIAGLTIDLFNDIPLGDVARGISRNVIFGIAVVAGQCIIALKGISGWAWALFLTNAGIPVVNVLTVPEALDSVQYFAKFGGGASFAVAASLVVARRGKTYSVVLLLLAAVFFAFSSFRGMTLMCFMVATLLVGFPIHNYSSLKLSAFGLALIIALGSIFVPPEVYSSIEASFDESTEARELSSMLRTEMAEDAWAQFLDRPFSGHGTWQHARNYVDSYDASTIVGVHSIVIQLAFEYGIVGLGFIIAVLSSLIKATYKMAMGTQLNEPMVQVLIYWSIVQLVYNIVLSPFAGDSRFIYGLLFSGVLETLRDKSSKGRVLVKFGKPKEPAALLV